MATADLDLDERVNTTASSERDRSWQTVVWNDPVNLMSYVVHVFRSYFGYSQTEANRLMLAVHNDGLAVVAEGAREVMELHAHAMHDYGLWATVRRSPQ
ncbi:ATP-dependent Clp protease adaptor protein ClpS [Microbacterium halimionae]|uniref:ATP-dependent Clp protease adapter protein ClpS n=1 Tax=Microbacterium halimionae TaxID=1526413 RepID=A0A7W3JN55_9MICO|nr:ATP-dependent Clp protease adapter ClpS [Microbacterium halimionae]MBA8815932.1 ATP-dependent Clp protease adaptor protein ClpS [Microbacterium halimionae]NII96135.1 ATP-dependent Clp protease adaptor protein ClpS [Microbacterium halimionae]